MSKEMSLILLGIGIAILPHLGFPSDMKGVLLAVFGITVASIGFLLRGKTLSRGHDESERRPQVPRIPLSEFSDQ